MLAAGSWPIRERELLHGGGFGYGEQVQADFLKLWQERMLSTADFQAIARYLNFCALASILENQNLEGKLGDTGRSFYELY
ncbi:MAG: hypothetical protein KKE40_02400 [Planctomycetes bacterium]|nr:hypothetical protein [Planctomycetota bacterium]